MDQGARHYIPPRDHVTVWCLSPGRADLCPVEIRNIVIINRRQIQDEVFTRPGLGYVDYPPKPDSSVDEQSRSFDLRGQIDLAPLGCRGCWICIPLRLTFISGIDVKVFLLPLGESAHISFFCYRQRVQTTSVSIEDWSKCGY